jgi:hypothetical protein
MSGSFFVQLEMRGTIAFRKRERLMPFRSLILQIMATINRLLSLLFKLKNIYMEK